MRTDHQEGGLAAFGRFLRSQRTLAELSQRELARLTDLSDPYLSQLERGLHQPSVRVLKALAMALNVRADTMLAYAGWLEEGGPDRAVSAVSRVEDAVRADPDLTDDQKRSLIGVYRTFKGDHTPPPSPRVPSVPGIKKAGAAKRPGPPQKKSAQTRE